ncbi:sugar phosphate isomerase/epimerase family protein [Ruania halotolerans]|uniref:sugar phosphate isomerase/epimerase family protein n=1 Tax=Ruania halotolerans TaxID=2897773 RepID=UPI001E3AB125|nr:sugar phosphate isomerase/epimerase [Ruania halotolerans]UFU07011.1 sugar phosphate isomerase/epimerase [Ruania halotolerans]
MTGAPISVQLYSVRDAMSTDMTATLRRLAEIGFQSVEAFGFVDRVDEYLAAKQASGLEIPSGHAKLVEVDDPSATFDAAKALGIGTVIDPAIHADKWSDRQSVEGLAARLNSLAGQAADRGLQVGYHNHWWELAEIDGTPALEIFAAALDERVVLEVDTYWAEVGGQSAPALQERLGDQVGFLHIKDGPLTRDNKAQLPAGAGQAPIEAILAASPSAVRVVEFDDYDGDVFEGVATSLAYLVGRA